MAKLSAAEVQAGTGGTLVEGSGNTVFSSVSIDTRTLQKGAVFFAIRGPNQDGHRFIPDAFSQGDKVRHPAFGQGIVSKQVAADRVEVVFRDAGRKLLHLEYTTLEKM